MHVNDCTIAATNIALVDWVKSGVKKFVKITDLGEIHWLLGIEVKRDWEGSKILLSQRSYINVSFYQYSFEDLKPVSTPMNPATHLSSIDSPQSTMDIAQMAKVPYQEAVGTLIYVMLGTQLDITYAVQFLLKFSKNPGKSYWKAVKRVFQYLKGTCGLELMYGGIGEEIRGYIDANGNIAENWYTTSGYAFMINGGAVSWSAKH